MGQKFIGSIGDQKIDSYPYFGEYKNINLVICKTQCEEVMVALEHNQYDHLSEILFKLRSLPSLLMIRITPDSYDFLMGNIKVNAVHGEALIELPAGKMTIWQRWLKRTIDIFISILVIMVLSPFILMIAFITKFSSRGAVLYSQIRIGQYNKPFTIFKFRSMNAEAESNGPALSFDGDMRCTPWGTFMRKWRLDEMPQFWNV